MIGEPAKGRDAGHTVDLRAAVVAAFRLAGGEGAVHRFARDGKPVRMVAGGIADDDAMGEVAQRNDRAGRQQQALVERLKVLIQPHVGHGHAEEAAVPGAQSARHLDTPLLGHPPLDQPRHHGPAGVPLFEREKIVAVGQAVARRCTDGVGEDDTVGIGK